MENILSDERSPESVVAKISWILGYNYTTESVKNIGLCKRTNGKWYDRIAALRYKKQVNRLTVTPILSACTKARNRWTK